MRQKGDFHDLFKVSAHSEKRAPFVVTHSERRGGGSQVLASALEFVFTAESNDDGEARRKTDADDETFSEMGYKLKHKNAQ